MRPLTNVQLREQRERERDLIESLRMPCDHCGERLHCDRCSTVWVRDYFARERRVALRTFEGWIVRLQNRRLDAHEMGLAQGLSEAISGLRAFIRGGRP